MFDLMIVNGTVVTEGGVSKQNIGIQDGKIVALWAPDVEPLVKAHRVLEAADLFVFPGVVEPHAHIGLGGAQDWETETASALHGGVTTVFNYVMGSESYDVQIPREHDLATDRTYVDYGLHIVPCTEEHLANLVDSSKTFGVNSFKYFMSFRGDEGAYLGVTGSDDGFLFEYLKVVATIPGGVACIHAENIEIVWKLRAFERAAGHEGLDAWNRSRPDYVEAEAISRVAYLSQLSGTDTYIVHTSSERSLREVQRIRSERRAGIDPSLYVETCAHYLTHTEGAAQGLLAKANPPLRSDSDREALWHGLKSGLVNTIGSDHSARRKELKTGSVWTSPAGIAGIGVQLSALLNFGYHDRGLPLETIAAVSSTTPAKIFGVYPQKGTIQTGSDADLVLVDLAEVREVESDSWGSNAGYNLYEGMSLKGWPVTTISRGEVVFDQGHIMVDPGSGKYLFRKG